MREKLLSAAFILVLLVSIGSAQTREVNVGEEIRVGEGETLEFGPDNVNELKVEGIEDPDHDDHHYFEFSPGVLSEDPLRIVHPDGRETGGMIGVEFESATYDIIINSHDVDAKTALIEIKPDYSESSNFKCEDYEPTEKYAFCTNEGEEAEKEIDLGAEKQTFNFVNNDEEDDLRSLFITSTGRNVEFNYGEQNDFQGAKIEVVEWRGLTDEYEGKKQQVVLDVEPAEEPEASVSFGSESYLSGEEVKAEFQASVPGNYVLEFNGAGVSKTVEYGEDDSSDTIKLEPDGTGTLQVSTVAPSSSWDVLDSDRKVDSAEAQIQESSNGYRVLDAKYVTDRIGGKVTDIKEETVVRFGNENQNSLYIESFDTQSTRYGELTGYVGSPGDGNRFEYTQEYERGFLTRELDFTSGTYYLYICYSSEPGSLDIGLQKDKESSADSCYTEPVGEGQNYDLESYSPGEKVELQEGEGLEWGDNRFYLKEALSKEESDFEHRTIEGYAQFLKSYQEVSPVEGTRMENRFYDGKYWTMLCETDEDSAVIHISDDRQPRSVCSDDTEGHSFGDLAEVEEGEKVTFEGNPVYMDSVSDSSVSLGTSKDNANNGISLLYSTDPVPLGSEKYVSLCQTDTESGSAVITMTEGRKNPLEACNVDVSEYRDSDYSGYDMKDYEIGESVKLGEGDGITFDGSAVFIESIEIEDGKAFVKGYSEWVRDSHLSTFVPPSEGSSSTVWFRDRELVAGTCNVSPEEIKIVLEEQDKTGEGFPEDWCKGERGGATKCDEIIENAQSSTSRKTCTDQVKRLECPSGDKIYTAKNGCEIDYLEERGWTSPEDEPPGKGRNRVSLAEKGPFMTGEEVELEIEVTEKIAGKGYQVKVEGPESYSENFEGRTSTYSFRPGKAGEYTVKLLPKVMGHNIPVIGNLLQGGSLAEKTFNVKTEDGTTWKEYCNERGYETEGDVQKAIRCLSNEVVPNCFSENPADQCMKDGDNRVAVSTCQSLLSYQYDPETQKCVS